MEIIYTVPQLKMVTALITKNLEDGFDKNIPRGKFIYFLAWYPRATFYKHLQECGYILIFKQTITVGGTIKGNCDAELVLKTVSDFLQEVLVKQF